MLACWCPVHAYVSSFCGLTLQYDGTVHDISILFVHAHCNFQARDGLHVPCCSLALVCVFRMVKT